MPDSYRKLDQWGPLDARLLYMSFWFEPAAFGSGKRFGAQWPEIIGLFENFRTTYVWEKREMEKAGARAIESIFLSQEKRDNLWKIYSEEQERLKNISDKVERLVTKNNDPGEIRDVALQLAELIKSIWEIGVTPEVANFGAPEYLRKKLIGFVPAEKINDALEILLTPEDFSFHQKSEKELLELSIAYNGKIPDAALEKYADKWHWVENDYFGSKRLSDGYFRKIVGCSAKGKIEDKLKSINQYYGNVKKRKRRVFDDYQLPESIKSLSAILSHSIWWQDDRKGVAWRVHATLDKLSEWASQFFGVAFESLMLYRAEEWSKLFETGISVQTETIKAREKLAIFVLNEKGVTEYLGRKAEALKEKYFSVPSVEPGSIKEFNGTKVSVGKVTGRARILFTPKNVISMREGEVLVAPMTSPDYIIAMRKAAAIVTDVGGLMSHAAIVSRELGVPCIVGTKIATKVLKDGDLVEVNANDGIVKIIKKSDKR